jgi:hypothetical protein
MQTGAHPALGRKPCPSPPSERSAPSRQGAHLGEPRQRRGAVLDCELHCGMGADDALGGDTIDASCPRPHELDAAARYDPHLGRCCGAAGWAVQRAIGGRSRSCEMGSALVTFPQLAAHAPAAPPLYRLSRAVTEPLTAAPPIRMRPPASIRPGDTGCWPEACPGSAPPRAPPYGRVHTWKPRDRSSAMTSSMGW